MTGYLDGSVDTTELKRSEDRRELQKNARILGEAHRAIYHENQPPISELPTEILGLIAKFSLFHGNVLEEKEVNQIIGEAFKKPALAGKT